MARPVALLSVATAVAPNQLLQSDAEQAARVLFEERFPRFERMAPVFTTAGIRARQLVKPVDWYLTPRGWPERTDVYLEGAGALFAGAAIRALDEAGLRGADVDIVVTVSSTGIATPSLEARALETVGFRSEILRVPVFGLGCAGGVSGLALGAMLARATPGAIVLVVAVELCSLSFRLDNLTKADIVATALFGDGAAACVLRSGEGGLADVTGSAQRTWPGTIDIMGWRMEATGFGVIFDRAIPPFVRDRMRPAMEAMLAAQGMTIADVGRFVCHPGGSKVLEALELSLSIEQGGLDHERDVLLEHGNMSAPTVLFVLERALRAGLAPTSVLTALGPGFTGSSVTLKQAA